MRIAAAVTGEETNTLLHQETAAVVLLGIAAVVAVAAARFKFPYTVALVFAGFGASALGDLVRVDVSPDFILALLVPPLLFEATLHLPWRKLKADLVPVLLFALLGTVFGTLTLGFLVNQVLGVPLAAAFAFGALISATDPVAVIAFFKSLGAPKRLSVLVEGESLFNDAIAVVAFGLAMAAGGGEAFTLSNAFSEFVIISAGGLAVGLALGYLISAVFLARVDDPLIETSTTLALAYGSYLLAEEFGAIIGQPDRHFSGILAVVAAGLMVGNVGLNNTSPSTRLTLEHFWELLTFLVNSMVFLVIGLEVSPLSLTKELDAVALALVAVLVVRAVIVYGLSFVAGKLQRSRLVPIAFRHVMVWAGLRGAISLALVLNVDKVFDAATAETVKVMTFGVVLFTLIIQGTTITPLMNKLGLSGKADVELLQQRHQAKIYMSRAGQAEVARLGSDGVLFDNMADALSRTYQDEIKRHSAGLRSHFSSNPELEVAMLLQARRDALVAENSSLGEIVRSGLIESAVAEELFIELNNRLAVLELLEERWESDPVPDFAQVKQGGAG